MQRCGLKSTILLHNSIQKLHHSHIYVGKQRQDIQIGNNSGCIWFKCIHVHKSHFLYEFKN
jgi:hypothetical protein